MRRYRRTDALTGVFRLSPPDVFPFHCSRDGLVESENIKWHGNVELRDEGVTHLWTIRGGREIITCEAFIMSLKGKKSRRMRRWLGELGGGAVDRGWLVVIMRC